jgi:hypothetical protein
MATFFRLCRCRALRKASRKQPDATWGSAVLQSAVALSLLTQLAEAGANPKADKAA